MSNATRLFHPRRMLALALMIAALLTGCVVAPLPGTHVRGNVVVGVAPVPGMVWMDGYWAYGAHARRWVPGYWGYPRHR